MAEDQVGIIVNFYAKPSVAALKVTHGMIKKGDLLRYKGHTTDFTEVVARLEIENQPVEKAQAGDVVGVKVKMRVREKDKVYKIVE